MANVDTAEIAKFEALASRWWDKNSEFKPLHDINPLRANFIDERSPVAQKGIIDVGCGGGILAESLAQRGAIVTGIDMGEAPLSVARLHALESGVELTYEQITAEDKAVQMPGAFDVVTCMAEKISAILDIRMQLGECPIWHPQEAALYWIDIDGRAVHRFAPASKEHRYWPMPTEPGCIAISAAGGLIVALRSGLELLDTDSGQLSMIAAAPYDPETTRFNDGRCDAAGRLWVGTIFEPRTHPDAALFCIEHAAIRDSGKRATVSNGVAFSPDNKTLYHADTTSHRIHAYEYDIQNGSIGNSRLLKEFSRDKLNNYGGRPDGAAVDSEGAYWCAMYEGGRLLRLSSNGDVLQEIALPVRCPTMMAFGGEDLRTLFITTVSKNRPAEELEQYPLSGCVLSLRVDVAGLSEHAYLP